MQSIYRKIIYVISIIPLTIGLSFFLAPAASGQTALGDISDEPALCKEIKYMITIPTFSQWGQPWSQKTLAPSNLTLATHGCYLTSIAMLMHNGAITFDPGQVRDKIVAVNGLLPSGEVTYSGVMAAFPQVYFHERGYTSNTVDTNIMKTNIDVALRKIQRLVSLGQPVILSVDNIGNDNNPDHAVVLFDAPDDLNKWRIKDPDGGLDIFFKDKYGDPRTEVFGWIVILISPISFPDDGLPGTGQCAYKLAVLNKQLESVPNLLPAARMNAREALSVLLNQP